MRHNQRMRLSTTAIETTLRESMLYEAGVLAGETKALKEAAGRVRQLAAETSGVDFGPFQTSLAELAKFLVERVAPKVREAKLKTEIVNGVQLLPANGRGVVDFTKLVANNLTALSGALEAEGGAKADAFAKQVAEVGELTAAPVQARRGLLVRVLKRVAEQL